jgi:hypothetical protein
MNLLNATIPSAPKRNITAPMHGVVPRKIIPYI